MRFYVMFKFIYLYILKADKFVREVKLSINSIPAYVKCIESYENTSRKGY